MLTSIGWLSLLGGFATRSAIAQHPWFSPFGPHVPTIGSKEAYATFADLDEDSRIDVVVARAGHIVLGRATGGTYAFTTKLPGSPAAFHRRSQSGGFVGLTCRDLVYVDSQLAAARLIVATGNNTYAYGATTTALLTVNVAPQAVDIDADGTCELAFVNVAGKLAVHSVAATGTWASVVSMPAYSGSVRTYVYADFDGDGDGDFVVFTDQTGPQNLRLLRANGGNTYIAGPTTALTPGSIVASAPCAAVDVDQDGDLDLAYARALPTGIQIARNDGTGAFTLDPMPLPTASPFAISDLDGDRDGDLVGVSVVGHMTTLKNDGSGQFLTSVPDSFVAKNAIAIRLAHVDGDDAIDALVATYDASAPAGLAVRVLTALGIDGGGFKAAPGTSPQSITNPALAIGDVDTDGVLEAVRSFASQLETSEWDGQFVFALQKTAIAPPSDRIELADLNQDGLLDCIGDAPLGSNPPFGISVSMNQHGALTNGVSVFATKPAVQAHQADFALGDYDGDADLDAVVVGWPKAPGLPLHALRQMVNQGDALGARPPRSSRRRRCWTHPSITSSRRMPTTTAISTCSSAT
ncbi:MAG: VCBS repeat-containing protein [Planctomycetes bacterium]|nr:VCBS repeat-containing protein [Planctomycetota bacterium]